MKAIVNIFIAAIFLKMDLLQQNTDGNAQFISGNVTIYRI